jgi:hypothetical protein
MEITLIRPLSETDIDGLIAKAGGVRAHVDADRREARGADYVFGNALIELKVLDHEELREPTRQARLAELFRDREPNRPVIVIDRAKLPDE